ncbi:MAG: M14 metallopeptidase family protein [Acidobacteriaceae bacterium]
MKKAVAAVTLALALSSFPAFAASAKAVTSPEQAFGFKPGTDRRLADWKQLTIYYQSLARQSPRVRYTELGKTTEGRPFVALTISSVENLAHLARYQEINRRLADPRVTTPEQARALIAQGKTILLITFNIHSTEIASSQTAAQFAYEMAAESTPEVHSILNNVILLLVPSLNPDGQQLVVDWYKKYLGTPYEGCNPPVLWAHYTGHDDNRDWVGITQAETQHAVKLINEWHPHILYDLHQMGADGPRIYLPPWVDPIDPDVDPLLVSSMNALGTQTAEDIVSAGQTGVLIHGVYDFWSPLRDYISYHNGLRILTESASANIATPINVSFDQLGKGIGYDAKVATWNFPSPWKGGAWRLGDIVHDQLLALFSIARSASVDRERFLTDFYTVASHAVHPTSGPFAYVIPPDQRDPVVATRLVNLLRTAAVEVEQAQSSFVADETTYPAGSYIVRLDQPNRSFAKTILEIQHYPDLREYPGGPPQRPYDVTAQTLPLLFGVSAAAINHPFTVSAKPVDHVIAPAGSVDPGAGTDGYFIDDSTNSSLYALFDLLKDGVHADRLAGGAQPAGTIYIPEQGGVEAKLSEVAKRFSVKIQGATQPVTGKALAVTLPRIGLYQSWVPSMDEGWTRFVFDQNGIPYRRLVDTDIRKGNLHEQLDVIVLPDNSPPAILTGKFERPPGEKELIVPPPLPSEYTGGLGDAGVAALKAFVEDGGTIVTLNRASEVYVRKDTSDVRNVLAGVPSKEFYVPGSILQVAVDTSNPIGFGSTPTVPVFFEGSPSFQISGDAVSVAHYTSDNPLLSGWILGGKYLNGTSAIAVEPRGKGHIVLFGFRPQYRALSEVTYKFLFNALLYSTSAPEVLNSSTAQLHGSSTIHSHPGVAHGR